MPISSYQPLQSPYSPLVLPPSANQPPLALNTRFAPQPPTSGFGAPTPPAPAAPTAPVEPIATPVTSNPAPAVATTPTAQAPIPLTPQVGPVEYPKTQPIQAGSTLMGTGVSIGAAAGNVPGAIVGGAIGFGIDTLIAARKEEAAKRETEKQMNLTAMQQRHAENVAKAQNSAISSQNAVVDRRTQMLAKRQQRIEQLNRTHAALQNKWANHYNY